MDALVLWEDGTKNVVLSSELMFRGVLKKGTKVKMFYEKKWYNGKVILTECDINISDEHNSDYVPVPTKEVNKLDVKSASEFRNQVDIPDVDSLSDSSDNVPLAQIKAMILSESLNNQKMAISDDNESEISEPVYDSDADPPYTATCEYYRCKGEVWSSCHRCWILLCHDHFMDNPHCDYHTTRIVKKKITRITNVNSDLQPEQHQVEGSEKEGEPSQRKKGIVNKQKVAKRLRNLGEEYVTLKGKIVKPRSIKPRCKNGICKKLGRFCATIQDSERSQIFDGYYALGDINRQREFIIFHTEVTDTKQKTSKREVSRRQKTIRYFFTINNVRVPVCKTFFINTLDISDRVVRTALEKTNPIGLVELDKRGGRKSEAVIARDIKIRSEIEKHIDRFPRMESHYCRASSSREYLHPDLSVSKMYFLHLQSLPEGYPKPSLSTYQRVFESKNLSFHTPKKDQCSLCVMYKTGDSSVKSKLEEKFNKHTKEKNAVRQQKEKSKQKAEEDNTFLCASFDLQQVIYLPCSNESAVFYKRRFSVFNFTFYNIFNKDCFCYTWSEADSKRGSSEIATCVYNALQFYDSKGIKVASLYSDGCSGQNKNSIMATMLLYTVLHSTNLDEISLKFFETSHGQNEGDSVHSTISYAIKHAGNIFIPSQLFPVFKLARRQHPYNVCPLQYNDFLDFKTLAKELRVLTVKKSESGDPFKWTEIMELKVSKNHPQQIFFKTSHLAGDFKVLSLKRLGTADLRAVVPNRLNNQPNKISQEKYSDLQSMCMGETPVIRLEEHKKFYRSLPH